MDKGPHPIDQALRRLSGEPQPSSEAIERAHDQLQAAMSAPDLVPLEKRGFNWRVAVATAVSAAVAFVLVAQPFAASPATAALLEIAEIAVQQDPLTATDSTLIYIRSQSTDLAVVPADDLGDTSFNHEHLVYLQPTAREQWTGDQGTVQIRSTNLEPIFFQRSDRDAYYTAGLDTIDRIGEAVTTTVQIPLEDWPTNIDDLDAAIRVQTAAGRDLPADVEYLDVALDILTHAFTDPGLRADILTLMSRLRSLEVVSNAGTYEFSVDYIDAGVSTRLIFTLDSKGNLVSEQLRSLDANPIVGIPAGTVIHEAIYEAPRLVQSLQQP